MCKQIRLDTLMECPKCKEENSIHDHILVAFISPGENGLIKVTFTCTKFETKDDKAHKFEGYANTETIAQLYFPELQNLQEKK